LNISDVKFSFDNASGTSFNITATNKSGHWSASYNVSVLAEGNHLITIFANDTANNMNNTETITFTVDNSVPKVTYVTANGLNFSKSSYNKTFSANIGDVTAQRVLLNFDNASGTGFNITLLNTSGEWSASYNVSALAEGSHTITVIANDTHGNVNNTQTLTFNIDYTFFTVTSLASGSLTTSAATITWTTGSLANSTVHYGTTRSLGSATSSTNRKTSHSIALSGLSASTLYYVNVTSCDYAGNCNSTGTESFTTSASSSGSGGGGGGGGGGSGGGGSSKSTPSATASASKVTSSEPSTSSSSNNGAVSDPITETPTLPNSFQKSITITSGTPTSVSVGRSDISIKEIIINSKVDREINLEVESLSEKPVNLPELENVYQFIKVTAELPREDVETVDLTFAIPKSWLQENNYDRNTVALNIYQQEQWLPLKTTIASTSDTEVTFNTEVSHLSIFAITAQAVEPQEDKFTFTKMHWYILLGSLGLIIFVLILYLVFRKKDVY